MLKIFGTERHFNLAPPSAEARVALPCPQQVSLRDCFPSGELLGDKSFNQTWEMWHLFVL